MTLALGSKTFITTEDAAVFPADGSGGAATDGAATTAEEEDDEEGVGSSVGNEGVSEASVLESSQMALVSLVLVFAISNMEASVGEVMAVESASSSDSS